MIKIGVQYGQEKCSKWWAWCTCHQLVPGVGTWENQGGNGGFTVEDGNGLSALSEGKIQDVILGLNEVVGEIEIL